ncbi:MAG TPA: L,D-transpeptidase family protein [Streptosporangiaceae bacterium]|nr:L,D-transpeptidase family protein [Streptosporangiaceae bacterium]
MGEEPEASGVSDGGLTGSGGAHGLRSALDRQTALSPSGSVFEPRTPTVSPSGSGSGSVWGDDPLGLAKPAQARATSETRPRSSSTGSSVWGDDPLGLSKSPVTQRKSASGSSSVWGDDPLGLSKSPATQPKSASGSLWGDDRPDTQEKSSGSDGSPWAADPLSPRGSVFKLAPSAQEPSLEPASLDLDDVGDSDSTSPFAKPDLTDDSASGASGNGSSFSDEPPTVIDAPAIDPNLARESAVGAAEVAAFAADQGGFNGDAGLWSASTLGVSSAPPAGPPAPAGAGPGGWSPSGSAPVASPPSKRRGLAPFIGIAAALVVLIGGGSAYYFGFAHKSSTSPTASGGTKPGNTAPKAAPIAKGPERLVSTTPANGETDVNGGAGIRVVFSEPLSANSPMPTLHPKIKGSWHVDGNAAVFVPASGIWQRTKVRVSIPTGPDGIRSSGGGVLSGISTAASAGFSFTTGKFSEVRLLQLLAQLDYLPLTWAPASGSPAPLTDAAAQYSAAYDPPQGNFTWESGYPSRLMKLWKPDGGSEILRGAIAAFQADHGLIEDMIAENQQGLITTGPIGHRLWVDIFKALAKGQTNKHGYTYAVASQHSPETLTVWHDGKVIFHHLANTGIPAAPTTARTDPVYIRYQSQIMKGTNPDGSKYADQVYWVAYFHNGEAVHYFPRYSYGSQQSLGCVELPYSQAKSIWPYLTYGTLVTVTEA